MGKELQNYAEAYLMCRELGHSWAEDEVTKSRTGGRTVVRVLGCTRCNMSRIDTYKWNGELIGRLYRQPKGYKLEFRPLVQNIRGERFSRLQEGVLSGKQRKGRR